MKTESTTGPAGALPRAADWHAIEEVTMSAPISAFRASAPLVFLALLSHSALAQPWLSENPSANPRTSTTTNFIPIGSALSFGGTNAPDTYSSATTFSSTPVLVDNGAVRIWQEQIPTGSTGEWDVFYMETVSGVPLAGNISGYWDILMNYDLSAPVNFDQNIIQWLVSGVPVSPLSGIGNICCVSASNPILPGPSFYNSGFTGLLPAGVETNWREVYVTPYSLVSSGGVNPNTANELIFALHFSIPLPTVTGVVSASQYGEFPTFAPGSWIEIYGTGLASTPQTWASSDFDGINAPTKLAATSVTIAGQPVFIDYVSPTQVNAQVPGGLSTGAQSLVVTTAAGSSTPFTVNVNATQPGLLAPSSFNIGGTQYVAAQFANSTTYVLPPGAISGLNSQRAKPGDTITLYGIGFGPVAPNTPPGQIAEALTKLTGSLTISFGGTPVQIPYDGLAPNFVGLYQINVTVPPIAASDSVPVTFSLDNVNSTQTLSIAIGN